MAKTKVNDKVVERNVHLTGEIVKYILDNPKMLDVLPEKFELVLLPERRTHRVLRDKPNLATIHARLAACAP
jgi:hypothetical protein